ncbi:hypothetical protein MSPP1_002777 [Malassezia sp. CBS 17886]|nr:hypothetical protein MSPP1_002777 [Malassezia sp. CBS 17886]
MAQKVLFVGPTAGRVSELVSRACAIEAKHGPFAAAFLVGDVFEAAGDAPLSESESQLLDGTLALPVATYFFHGTRALPSAVQARIAAARDRNAAGHAIRLAPHLFYLGSAGITMVAEGFRVAFCGGPPPTGAAPRTDVAREGADAHGYKALWASLDSPDATRGALDALLRDPALTLGTALPPPAAAPESLHAAKAYEAARALYETQLAGDALLLQAREPIDFLLTTAWPQRIEALSNVPLPDPGAPTWGVAPIARLAEAARPRYHFAHAPTRMQCAAEAEGRQPGGPARADGEEQPSGHAQTQGAAQHVRCDAKTLACGAFWEREPYENPPFAALPPPSTAPITRFLSLADVANTEKVRWFMALNVVPADALEEGAPNAAQARPAHATASPLVAPPAPKREGPGDAPNFRFEAKRARHDAARPRHGRRAREPVAPVGPENCWFCLSNPNVEKHLIVAIGEECYVALPKGQVPVSSDERALVPGGGHALIVPIAHVASQHARDLGALRTEVCAWKDALAACFAAYDAAPVSWEVVRRSGTRAGHTQIQVVPVPKAQLEGLEAYFREAAERDGYVFETDEDAAAFVAGSGDHGDFCLLEVAGKRMLLLLHGQRFNLQFPRETLTAFLDMPERGDWKACVRPGAVEAAECDEFKDAFREYSEGVGAT